MATLLHVGLALFGAGLVLSHWVLFATRRPAHRGQPMKRSHTVLMWGSVALAVLGLALSSAGFFLSE